MRGCYYDGHNHEVIMRGCEYRHCKYLYGTFVVSHNLVVGRSYMLTHVRITKYTFLQHVQYYYNINNVIMRGHNHEGVLL